jgi:DNA-binding transcriptional regulator/RsmH inhibitor MraZ
VAKTVLWRYGKSIDIKQRREIGPEHRNVMNEHRFNRLEEQLATIVVAGASQWQGMEQIMKTVQAMPLDRNTGMASLAAVASANAQQTSTSGSI